MANVENLHQLIEWQPPEISSIIGDGILLPETRLIIFGPAKTWKSMTTIHTAFTLATGKHWFGHATANCVPLLLQLEIPKAVFRKRVVKYAKGADSYPRNLFFMTEHYLKLDTSFGLATISKALDIVSRVCPNQHIVFIVDPLYKIVSGHINDPRDAQTLQDNFDQLKEKYHCSIIIVHHEGKQVITSEGVVDRGPEAMMGSSYWNNWCDTAMSTELLNPLGEANRVEMKFELVRHAETVLEGFHIRWDRATLYPELVKKLHSSPDELEEVSTR